MELFILVTILVTGGCFFGFYIYLSTRIGENCPGYPYNCMCCSRAARCLMEISKKNEKERRNGRY